MKRPRSSLLDLTTQLWVRLTGRRVALTDVPWLDGPTGDVDVIGESFFHRLAERDGLIVDDSGHPQGLLPSMSALSGPSFDALQLHPQVQRFYLQTSTYGFDVEPVWSGGLRPFAWLVSALFSRRLRQLNVPLSKADVARGATSEVFAVRDGDKHLFTAWVRSLASTNNTLYVGAYSTTEVPGFSGRCIKVVFPLPNGNAVVLMRPELQANGSLRLVSSGTQFGDPGFYFVVKRPGRQAVAKYVRALEETIHVFVDDDDDFVRAEHRLQFMGRPFLLQRYSMERQSSNSSGAATTAVEEESLP